MKLRCIQTLEGSQHFSRRIHFRKRSFRRDQRLSVTDLMAFGKLRPTGNQDEGHDDTKQAGATSQSSYYRHLIHMIEAASDLVERSIMARNEFYTNCRAMNSMINLLKTHRFAQHCSVSTTSSRVWVTTMISVQSFITSDMIECMLRVKENERARETRGAPLARTLRQ